MQASESSMPSSMLTSMMLAPPRTWSTATVAAPGQSFAFTSRSNFFDPVTLVRSPIIWKFESGRDDQRLESGEPGEVHRRARWALRGGSVATLSAISLM